MKKYVVLAIDRVSECNFYNIFIMTHPGDIRMEGFHINILSNPCDYAYKKCDMDGMLIPDRFGHGSNRELIPFIDIFYNDNIFGEFGSIVVLDDDQAAMVLAVMNL